MNQACAEAQSPGAAESQLLPAELSALYDAHSRAIYYLALRFLGAINHCKNVRAAWHDRHVLPGSDNDFFERLPGGDSPLRILETKELGDRIQRALDGLPAEYRLLLLLVSDQELSYQEAGALTGQSADAVRGKLFRARKAFAGLFAKTA